jgi:hypothetical protein
MQWYHFAPLYYHCICVTNCMYVNMLSFSCNDIILPHCITTVYVWPTACMLIWYHFHAMISFCPIVLPLYMCDQQHVCYYVVIFMQWYHFAPLYYHCICVTNCMYVNILSFSCNDIILPHCITTVYVWPTACMLICCHFHAMISFCPIVLPLYMCDQLHVC